MSAFHYRAVSDRTLRSQISQISDTAETPRRKYKDILRKSSSDVNVDRKYRKENRKTIFIAEVYKDKEDNDSDFEELDLSDIITNVDDVDAKRDNEFVKMAESDDLEEILDKFKQIKQNIGLSDLPETFTKVFPKLQDDLSAKIPHRYSELLRHLHQRSLNKEYCGNRVAAGKKVLIIGDIHYYSLLFTLSHLTISVSYSFIIL